jgi:hypothetical protein
MSRGQCIDSQDTRNGSERSRGSAATGVTGAQARSKESKIQHVPYGP